MGIKNTFSAWDSRLTGPCGSRMNPDVCYFFRPRPLSLFPGQVKREAVGEFVESFWLLWPTVTSNSSFYPLKALIPSGWPLHSSFELMREDSQWIFHQLIAKTGKWRHSFLEMPWDFHTANSVQGTVLYSKVRPFWSFFFFFLIEFFLQRKECDIKF